MVTALADPVASTPALALAAVDKIDPISRAEFEERYLRPEIPVVIRKIGDPWPAMKKWTPQYFIERFGDREIVAITSAKKSNDFGGSYGGRVPMKVRDFIEAVMTREEDLRLVARHTRQLIPELRNDFHDHDIGTGYIEGLIWLFVACKGSRTTLHFDFVSTHVFHTLISGRKTFYLFPQSEGRNLHRLPLVPRSLVDPAVPDFERFPRLRQARGYQVFLEPGDTLYMPRGMWHDVRHHDPSFAITLRFTQHQPLAQARIAAQLGKAAFAHLLDRALPGLWSKLQQRLA